jgi:hypothetical protein
MPQKIKEFNIFFLTKKLDVNAEAIKVKHKEE